MISFYTWDAGTLKQIDDIGSGFNAPLWIDLADPSTEEITRIQEFAGITREYLTDPLDRDERPRLETDDGVNSLIIRIACPEPAETETQTPFSTLPLGILLLPRTIITVCARENSVTRAFIDQIRRVCSPERQYRFTFQLLWHSAILYLRYLREIQSRVDMIQDDLATDRALRNAELMRLMTIQKSLVYFTTSLKANDIVLGRFRTNRQFSIADEDLDVLEDVLVEYRQALETASIHSDILSGALDVFATIISNNLNNVMKFLTSVTIIFMIPTLIASVYGMNVEGLPLSDKPYAFIVIIAGSIAVSLLTTLYFLRRRLLL